MPRSISICSKTLVIIAQPYPRQYLSKGYDEPRPFSRLQSWNSTCDKSCIDVAEDDRHARPFDKLGFFKDYHAKSALDIENELTSLDLLSSFLE